MLVASSSLKYSRLPKPQWLTKVAASHGRFRESNRWFSQSLARRWEKCSDQLKSSEITNWALTTSCFCLFYFRFSFVLYKSSWWNIKYFCIVADVAVGSWMSLARSIRIGRAVEICNTCARFTIKAIKPPALDLVKIRKKKYFTWTNNAETLTYLI